MSEEKREPKKYICLDCQFHDEDQEGDFPGGDYCQHFKPEYWEAQGYERRWGDAAVMNWPHLEILKRVQFEETDHPKTEFVVLAPHAARRPVVIYCYGLAHGAY